MKFRHKKRGCMITTEDAKMIDQYSKQEDWEVVKEKKKKVIKNG